MWVGSTPTASALKDKAMPTEEIYQRVMNFLDELVIDLGRDKYKEVLDEIHDEVGIRIEAVTEEIDGSN